MSSNSEIFALNVIDMEYHHLISKVKTKSLVWTTFGFPANEHGVVLNNNMAVCKLC